MLTFHHSPFGDLLMMRLSSDLTSTSRGNSLINCRLRKAISSSSLPLGSTSRVYSGGLRCDEAPSIFTLRRAKISTKLAPTTACQIANQVACVSVRTNKKFGGKPITWLSFGLHCLIQQQFKTEADDQSFKSNTSCRVRDKKKN
jgi:hypothetical protein